ncbi:MAG: L,D-transpeptidase family protein, partial [Lachnospiraceae bacterium]|nr:L,D-transpeptidase family protein [Lachnospiraceae bacterium]
MKKLTMIIMLSLLILCSGCTDKKDITEQSGTETVTDKVSEPEVVVLDMPIGSGADASESGKVKDKAEPAGDAAADTENAKEEEQNGTAPDGNDEDKEETGDVKDPEVIQTAVDGKKTEDTDSGAENSDEMQPENNENNLFWFEDTKTAKEHTQLIIVGDANGTSAPFTLYEKDVEECWHEIFSVKAYIGRHGYNDNRHQGDETTPTGVYHFTEAFGIADDPGCTIGYTKLNEHHYWVGNSDSPYYNTMISDLDTSDFSKKSSEHLIAYTVPYQYCLNISFNSEQTPGRGSAIFLHCYSERPDTGGCVAIPQEYMKQLLCRLHRDCVIAIDCGIDEL